MGVEDAGVAAPGLLSPILVGEVYVVHGHGAL